MTATPSASAVRGMPPFTVRWTEPASAMRKTEHTVEVAVKVPNENRPLTGHITATSADFLGRLPAGSLISTSRVVNDDADLAKAQTLWKAVQGSNARQWLTRTDTPGGHLDRDDMELVIQRGREKFEVYRADLGKAPQPVQDVISAAGRVVGDLRLGH